ncbi:synaptonemal complex central element protein 2-like [Antedon mediterranea]|uniref:synaptonemal complex central element protein 2-like n=1 Tax=Antedon mediterranea TaxID=105859 RepID=UPI003AF6E8D3
MSHPGGIPASIDLLEPPTGDGATQFQQSAPTESAAAQSGLVKHSTKLGLAMQTTRESIQETAQQLIHDLNLKRKSDAALISDFKKDLEEKVTETCKAVDLHMFQCYERNGQIMQEKLQTLFATLERIHKIEQEMEQFKQALGIFYKDIHCQSNK